MLEIKESLNTKKDVTMKDIKDLIMVLKKQFPKGSPKQVNWVVAIQKEMFSFVTDRNIDLTQEELKNAKLFQMNYDRNEIKNTLAFARMFFSKYKIKASQELKNFVYEELLSFINSDAASWIKRRDILTVSGITSLFISTLYRRFIKISGRKHGGIYGMPGWSPF